MLCARLYCVSRARPSRCGASDTLRTVIRLITGLFLILISATSAAAQTVYDGRAWLTVSLQGRVSQKTPWRWSFDSIARSRDGITALDTSTFRPMLVYN